MDTARPATRVNNRIYDELGDRWYDAQDDPVALLRAESACRVPWIAESVGRAFGSGPVRVLDVGCGAGFLSNALALRGFAVTGVDASAKSLDTAARHDRTQQVRYRVGDARQLPFPDRSFDVACAMDFLEHVDEPGVVVAEIARILEPGGLFFFHTFNRNWLSWLVVIKGVEWFVRNTPKDLHVLRLFLKPGEVRAMCEEQGLEVDEMRGLEPVIPSAAFFRLLLTGTVPSDFRFRFTGSTRIGFTGRARKIGTSNAVHAAEAPGAS
jgi:2-polyprenyl-6-hydroxyphenyl methylase/3-demethylubiquinone-9 3-methyltransferase